MNHEPVCATCQCEFRPEHNSVGLLDMYNPSNTNEPQPYQIWEADLWKCPKCGVEIVVGFGSDAILRHHEKPDFEKWLKYKEDNSKIIKNYPL